MKKAWILASRLQRSQLVTISVAPEPPLRTANKTETAAKVFDSPLPDRVPIGSGNPEIWPGPFPVGENGLHSRRLFQNRIKSIVIWRCI